MVCTAELWNTIFLQGRLEAYEFLVLSTIIKYTDCCCVYIFDDTLALSSNHSTRVLAHLLLKSGTNDRSIIMEQWYCLTHHVTSHQRTVTVIMLEEWDKSCRYRSNLLWSNVHQINICRRNYREVSILTTLNDLTDECTILVQWSITLTNDAVLLLLCGEINNILVIHIYYTICNLTIWSRDKAELVDSSIYTERRDKTDVRSFRTLNRTKTTIVCIVNVTNLETCTLTRKTTRTEGRKTTLVSYLSKRVGLVHEL